MEAATTTGSNYKKSTRWVMLIFVCLMCFLFNGLVSNMFNMLIVTIAEDLGWSAAERSFVSTAYLTGMIWFVFIAGIAIDKFSIRKLVGTLMLVAGVLVGARAFVKSSVVFYILIFVYGAAFAFILPSLTKMLSLWFAQRELATVNGLMTASSPLGQITGNLASIPMLAVLGGWQNLFIAMGIIIIILAICFLLFARDRKNIDAALKSDQIKEDDLGLWKNIKAVIKIPQVWMCILANACVLGMIYGGGTQTYVVLQIDPKWALPAQDVGVVVSMINISSLIAYLVVPAIAQRFFKTNYMTKYRILAICAGLICAVVTLIGITSYSYKAALIILFCSGLTHGALVPAPKIIMLNNPQVSGARAGTALGVYMTFERLAATIMTSAMAAVVAVNPERSALTLGLMYLVFYAISPILIFIMMMMDRSKAKKEKANPEPSAT